MAAPRFCRSCVHLVQETIFSNIRCGRTAQINFEPIEGRQQIVGKRNAEDERAPASLIEWLFDGTHKRCGPEGRYFEEGPSRLTPKPFTPSTPPPPCK